MACLKKHMELMEELSERLALPEEAVAGVAKLTVTAGRRALIENHRGILEYSAEQIIVATREGRIVLTGSSLGIKGMDRNDLLIAGKLQHAEWE